MEPFNPEWFTVSTSTMMNTWISCCRDWLEPGKGNGIYLSVGSFKGWKGAGEFSGDVVSTADNNYTAVDTRWKCD